MKKRINGTIERKNKETKDLRAGESSPVVTRRTIKAPEASIIPVQHLITAQSP